MASLTPFDWGGYLRLAEELAARTGDEAAQRSAISRAYYAALGRAIDLLSDEGRIVSPFKTHSFVWRAFKDRPDPRRAAVGANLDRLRQLRDRADYAKVFDGDPSALASDAVDWARNVLRLIDEIRSNPTAA